MKIWALLLLTGVLLFAVPMAVISVAGVNVGPLGASVPLFGMLATVVALVGLAVTALRNRLVR